MVVERSFIHNLRHLLLPFPSLPFLPLHITIICPARPHLHRRLLPADTDTDSVVSCHVREPVGHLQSVTRPLLHPVQQLFVPATRQTPIPACDKLSASSDADQGPLRALDAHRKFSASAPSTPPCPLLLPELAFPQAKTTPSAVATLCFACFSSLEAVACIPLD